MRPLFIVVSKICGLLQVYAGVTYLIMVLPLVGMLRHAPDSAEAEMVTKTMFHGEYIRLSFVSLGAMVAVTFGVAWLLVFRADWLADKLKIPDADTPTSSSVAAILYAGVKLIGLFIIVQGIPLLAQGLFQLRHMMPFGSYLWETMALPVVRILIGVLLVVKTQRIVGLIVKERSAEQGFVTRHLGSSEGGR